ncbi:hypothetical protein CMV_014691 [Castanea mollissima]|uniref:Uncharacterized protein n=1 Tax=Castanea mollissima TaxID=60419 RepID=A0A8J4R6D8_9ROSI|nr:hypothetical protein CMV_014691 [Castanea mollissima]
MKPVSWGLSLQESIKSELSLSKKAWLLDFITFFPMKSIVYISSAAATIFMVLPHEMVDGNLVPALFKDRPTVYHMFLVSALLAFTGSFSTLLIQNKSRIEIFCRVYAMASMVSALALVLYATAFAGF